jgi:hypothetical protein
MYRRRGPARAGSESDGPGKAGSRSAYSAGSGPRRAPTRERLGCRSSTLPPLSESARLAVGRVGHKSLGAGRAIHILARRVRIPLPVMVTERQAAGAGSLLDFQPGPLSSCSAGVLRAGVLPRPEGCSPSHGSESVTGPGGA